MWVLSIVKRTGLPSEANLRYMFIPFLHNKCKRISTVSIDSAESNLPVGAAAAAAAEAAKFNSGYA